MEKIEKYINKFYDFIDKIGKHNFVLIIFIFIALLTTTLYQTFSLYTESEGLSIIDGIETYSFILNNSNNTNSITVASGNSKYIDITVSNETETKLKYGLYYSSTSDLTDTYIGYLSRTKYLPNGVIQSNSNYIVTLKVVNTSLEDITINFGLKYGFENGGELPLNDGESWLSENIYGKPLSEVAVGSYVAYTGDNTNGCDTTDVNGWTSCSGKNANYESEENKGWCYQSNYKFSVNGWRVAYMENGSAHIVSAGATDCMCTSSDGTPDSISCSGYLSTDDIDKHFTNMNNVSLNYCNEDYIKGGSCITNASNAEDNTVWAMSATDFKKITGTALRSNSCFISSNDTTCGYGNTLIDNGGYYWYATPNSSYPNYTFFWFPNNVYVYNDRSNNVFGVRPVLALDSSVIVVKGKGTYEEPYIISNPDYNPNEPEEPDVPSGTDLVNSPNLDNGNLIPVYYDDTAEVWKKADSTNKNNSWYDYENKKWANAVIIDPSKKETYQTTINIDDPITESDIIAFYVWIPRYKYRVWNLNRQATEQSGTEANVYSYDAYSNGIEIEFEQFSASTGNVECIYDTATEENEANLSDKCYYNGSTTPIKTTDLNPTDAWYTHPAFTFGSGEDKEKTGFWIGKFETSNTETDPRILPDETSLRSQNVSTQFTTSKKFQSYLSSEIDAHMLTNLEWGAVAYLTHSLYGLCTDDEGTITCEGVNHNNSSGYFTGRSMGDIAGNGSSSTYGTYDYKGYSLDSSGKSTTKTEESASLVASTTKNVTGVYDMSGGAFEYVMGNMVDTSNNFYPSYAVLSGVTNPWNGSSTLDTKFYNSYSNGSTYNDRKAFNRARLGDATAEVLGGTTSTSAWKPGSKKTGSYSLFMYDFSSWFLRGGYCSSTDAGVFNFVESNGYSSYNYSFRSSLS